MAKGRKQHKNLDIRRADYHRMIAGSKNYDGFKCPGSNKK